MPKKPTARARLAREKLREAVVSWKESKAPIPTVRLLAEELGISYSSVSRMLTEFVEEGMVWQHPNGRYYPKTFQVPAGRGLPVVFIGRQIQDWSQLYRETIEGISEVCSALGSPLVFLSSDRLVAHKQPEYPPVFASQDAQREELRRLEPLIPRVCGAIIFDHLWSDVVLEELVARVASPRVILMRRTGLAGWQMGVPDFDAGTGLMLRHLVECGYEEVLIGRPFAGDSSVDQCSEAFAQAVSSRSGNIRLRPSVSCETPGERRRFAVSLQRTRRRTAVVVAEDNIAMLLMKEFESQGIACPDRVGVVSLQGTALAAAPLTRVRYDYRRLGRGVIRAMLTGDDREFVASPAIIEGRTTSVVPLHAT